MKAVIVLLAAAVALAGPSTPASQSDLGVQAPAVSRRVSPQYTEQARAAGVEGTVLVYVEIGTDGRVRNPSVIRGLGFGLDSQAVECVRQWRFRPGTRDGIPVVTHATVEVKFRLADPPVRV